MTWETFYLCCFALGLSLTLLSFAGGFRHLPHLRIGHLHGHATPVAKAGMSPISPWNGFTVTAFLCWFGGAGYLLEHYGGFVMPVILLLATLSGLAGGFVIFWFLAKVLLPHDRALTAEEGRMIGVLGRVSATIRAKGTGEILFSQGGVRRSSAARSEDEQSIEREAEVVVMRYERGIAYVRRWEEIAGSELSPVGSSRMET